MFLKLYAVYDLNTQLALEYIACPTYQLNLSFGQFFLYLTPVCFPLVFPTSTVEGRPDWIFFPPFGMPLAFLREKEAGLTLIVFVFIAINFCPK